MHFVSKLHLRPVSGAVYDARFHNMVDADKNTVVLTLNVPKLKQQDSIIH